MLTTSDRIVRPTGGAGHPDARRTAGELHVLHAGGGMGARRASAGARGGGLTVLQGTHARPSAVALSLKFVATCSTPLGLRKRRVALQWVAPVDMRSHAQ